MGDEKFDTNFAWFEWSFVRPEQVPTDDLRVTTEAASGDRSPLTWPRDPRGEERPWTT